MAFLWNSARLVFALLVAFLAHPFFHLWGAMGNSSPNKTWQKRWLQWVSHWALGILHVKLDSRGPVPASGLLVSNHQGYLDILCLNVLCPSIFVAKSEIKSWPLFGLFSSWSGTIFLDRKKKMSIPRALVKVVEYLRQGERVVIFPEGTDSDGTTVLPFHSSFFAAAIQVDCPVIPVAIRYHASGVNHQDEVVFWRDRRFLFHVIRLLGVKQVLATVTFGDPLPAGQDRKELTQVVRRRIQTIIEQK